MNRRIAAISTAAVLAALAIAASAGAAVIGVYRSNMESAALRGQVVKLSGDRCKSGGSEHAFRIYVGKRTPECAYRTPVIGRDLEVAVTGRLLQGTPKPVQRRAYLTVNLRAGGAGARYQLLLFPLQRKVQLRRVAPDGEIEYMHVERGVRAKGINRANQMRLRAFNVTRGPEKGKCRILAFVNKQPVADVVDAAAGELQGRSSGFGLGAAGNAKGALGSFDDVVVRVPSPY